MTRAAEFYHEEHYIQLRNITEFEINSDYVADVVACGSIFVVYALACQVEDMHDKANITYCHRNYVTEPNVEIVLGFLMIQDGILHFKLPNGLL